MSENGPSQADGASAWLSKHQTITETIKGLFRDAVKAITRRDEDEPQPQPQVRRRSGETDKGFIAAWRSVLRRDGNPPERAGIDTGRAFGEAAKAAMQRAVRIPAEVYTAAADYLVDTIDWLNLWEADNADGDNELDDDFDTQQNRRFPQP